MRPLQDHGRYEIHGRNARPVIVALVDFQQPPLATMGNLAAVVRHHQMAKVTGNATSVDHCPDVIRLRRVKVDTQLRTPQVLTNLRDQRQNLEDLVKTNHAVTIPKAEKVW